MASSRFPILSRNVSVPLYALALNENVRYREVSSLAAQTSTAQRKTHTVHLSHHPAYPKRAAVKTIFWDEEDPQYQPVDFTHQVVIDNDCTKKANGWADPAVVDEKFEKELASRISNSLVEGGRVIMVNRRPRNPIGRTGMTGRGLLGKYGANFAADPLVTRYDPTTGNLQMVAIQRSDTKAWAMPGGMVDPGETVSVTVQREFAEEAQNFQGEEKKEVTEKLNALFTGGGTTVYVGYVDDPRNTDISWMETSCIHFHIGDKFLAEHLQLEAGDDASKARWLDISDEEPDFKNLYASHRDMILKALLKEEHKYASTLARVAHL